MKMPGAFSQKLDAGLCLQSDPFAGSHTDPSFRSTQQLIHSADVIGILQTKNKALYHEEEGSRSEGENKTYCIRVRAEFI